MAWLEHPETYRRVLEDLPTGVYLVGRDGKILFWNYGAERITGHLRQDVVGHVCREDFLGKATGSDDKVSAAAVALDAVLRDGKAAEALVSFRHKTGHLVPVRLRAVALRDGQGAVIGAAECFDEVVNVADWDRRHDKLAEYGCLDAASGVLNHKMIESRLREYVATFADNAVPFCIVCFGFDKLEEVKSRYGAAAIAAVLRIVGQTLESSLRPTDFLGRWQENEFLAILTECNAAEIGNVGERLRRMVQAAKITWWGDALPVTVSVGATTVKPGDTMQHVLRRAERALQESVALGGNRVSLEQE